jgi:hypothetical protein
MRIEDIFWSYKSVFWSTFKFVSHTIKQNSFHNKGMQKMIKNIGIWGSTIYSQLKFVLSTHTVHTHTHTHKKRSPFFHKTKALKECTERNPTSKSSANNSCNVRKSLWRRRWRRRNLGRTEKGRIQTVISPDLNERLGGGALQRGGEEGRGGRAELSPVLIDPSNWRSSQAKIWI